jgi:hypothetical protein
VQQPRDAPVGAVIGFLGDELGKISNVAPTLGGGPFPKLEVLLEEPGRTLLGA